MRAHSHMLPCALPLLADSAAPHHDDSGADVVADHGVERGGCIAANGPLLVDAQIGSAVERIAAALAE